VPSDIRRFEAFRSVGTFDSGVRHALDRRLPVEDVETDAPRSRR
jgi:hypothetical protein